MAEAKATLAVPLRLGGEHWQPDCVQYVIDAWLNETSIDEIVIANMGTIPLEHPSPKVNELMIGEISPWRVGVVRNHCMLAASNNVVIQSGAELLPVGDPVPELVCVREDQLLVTIYVILLHPDETNEALAGRRKFSIDGPGHPPHGIRTLRGARGCMAIRRTTWLRIKGYDPEIYGHGWSNEDLEMRLKCIGGYIDTVDHTILHLYHADRDARHGDSNSKLNRHKMLRKQDSSGWFDRIPTEVPEDE